MSHIPRNQSRWQGCCAAVGIASLFGVIVAGQQPVNPQGTGEPMNRERELALKITDPFTLTAVGDLMITHPGIHQIANPATRDMIRIVQDADLAFANMETNIVDIPRFQGDLGALVGPKETAADVKAMGFDVISRGNNVAMSSGDEGMLSTNRYLEEVGIVHAGAGKNLEEARMPAYIQTPKGRVGIVSALSNAAGNGAATSQFGNLGGSAGINPLRVSRANVVTPEHLQTLRTIRNAVHATRTANMHPVAPLPANEPQDALELFGVQYKAGPVPGRYAYTMNAGDLRAILRSIRDAKFQSDFVIATVHSLEPPTAVELTNVSEHPADFLVDFAHQAIDNGADAFLGHGVHVLRGVEIYKGKPVFYGLHALAYQLHQGFSGLERYGQENPNTTTLTQAELEWGFYGSYGRPRMSEDNLESVIAESKYDGGRLVEVRLHPLDLGIDAPLSQKGLPRRASPEVARRILQRIQKLSQPFGTVITVEGNIGVIRVAATSTAR